jgi:excinuclease UvrABC ATPase subunit
VATKRASARTVAVAISKKSKPDARRGRPSRADSQTVERVRALHGTQSVRAIAAALKIPRSTVADILAEKGAYARVATRAPTYAAEPWVVELSDEELGAAVRAFLSDPHLRRHCRIQGELSGHALLEGVVDRIVDRIREAAEALKHALATGTSSVRNAAFHAHAFAMCQMYCNCTVTEQCDEACRQVFAAKGTVEHCKHCDGTFGCPHTVDEMKWLLGVSHSKAGRGT